MGPTGISESMERQVDKAVALAERALEGKRRDNNAPFIEHPAAVAKIVREEIGLTEECATAVYLHEASRFKPELLPVIRSEFGDDIFNIVASLNKISEIRPKDTCLEAENYKRLIVSYSKDPRVVIIKIADRLEIITTRGSFE